MLIGLGLLSAALARPACGTPALHRQSAPLFMGTVNEAYRPSSTGFVDSKEFPIRVHYRHPDDVQRVSEVVLPALELAWQIQIQDVGWPAPPPDANAGGTNAFDVYLTNEGTYGGAYVWGDGPDVVPDDNWYSMSSFMAIDESIPDDELLSWLAHELNHASQYAIDGWELNTFVWEFTAEVMADRVDDEGNVYIEYAAMPDFQEFPFLSLVFDGSRLAVRQYDENSFYEYGGIIFGMFLEQRFGNNDGATLLSLWDALAQPSQEATRDFVDALRGIDPDGGSLAELYTEFAVWRMFTGELDDGAHFEEGGLWGPTERVGLEDEIGLQDVDGYTATPAERPFDLGTSYFVVDLENGSHDLLHVDVVGESAAAWGVAWAVWYADGTAITGTAVGVPGQPVHAEIPLVDGWRAQFGVVNAGGIDVPSTGRVNRRSFELSLALVDPEPVSNPVPDPPTEPADPEAQSCGCQAGGGPGPWALLALFPVGVVLRRSYA